MCVCVRAAWPWPHVVNIVLFSAWLAHSFVFCSSFFFQQGTVLHDPPQCQTRLPLNQ